MEQSTERFKSVFSIARQTWVLYPCFSPLQNIVLYSPTACLQLSRVNAILQLLGLGPHTTTMLVPVSDRDKIKEASHTVSVASRIRGTCFLKVFLYRFLSPCMCSQFCRCPLSSRGDTFSNLLYVKGTGCFFQVPYKFQTRYAISRFTINISSI